jgi:hypothetical protein
MMPLLFLAEGVIVGVMVGWFCWRLPGVLRSASRSVRRASRRLYLWRVGFL